jgi:hypothetical protein
MRLDRVLGSAKERLDAQVLLDPVEEQLDLPSGSDTHVGARKAQANRSRW